MFTSRAEYRLLLREDNADQRLTEIGHRLGLVDEQRWSTYARKRDLLNGELSRLQKRMVKPEDAQQVEHLLGAPMSREMFAFELLRRPELTYETLLQLIGETESGLPLDVREQVEIQAKYQGYIDRQHLEVEKSLRNEEQALPDDIDYSAIDGLSNEVRQKLLAVRPQTVGQASRISGVTPAAVSMLLVHLKKRRLQKKSA